MKELELSMIADKNVEHHRHYEKYLGLVNIFQKKLNTCWRDELLWVSRAILHNSQPLDMIELPGNWRTE